MLVLLLLPGSPFLPSVRSSHTAGSITRPWIPCDLWPSQSIFPLPERVSDIAKLLFEYARHEPFQLQVAMLYL